MAPASPTSIPAARRTWRFSCRPGLASRRLLAVGGLAALLLPVSPCTAEAVRVTSWNLGLESENESTTAAIEEAASTLKALNPDVILLQEVKDWRMCERLALALRPLNYYVLICSAFHGVSPGAAGQPQVAIFSKSKAYFTWADAWTGSKQQQGIVHGVGFAAIQAGHQRLGLFTGLFGTELTGEQLARHVLEQLELIGQWETNQVQTFVVAASSGSSATHPSRILRRASVTFEQAGLIDATAGIPPDVRGTLRVANEANRVLGDCVFAGPAGVPFNTRITVSQLSHHYPITTDIELDPVKVSLALDIRAEARRQQQARTRAMVRTGIYWASGAAGVVVLSVVLLRRRRSKARIHVVPTVPSLRVAPRTDPPQVRPIIFAERPTPKPVSDDSSPLPRRPLNSTLRLQSPTRQGPDPEGNTPPPSQSPERPSTSTDTPPQSSPQGPLAVLSEPLPRTQGPVLTHDPQVREGVIRELSGWLKQRLIGKLVSDRAQLLQAQQLATRMASTLDDRLGRIEAQIQQQNQAYIQRIEELNRELAAAREENRELIRERIAQVKAEMEAARAKVLAEADLNVDQLRL